jgi:hypothetical protein
MYFLDFKERGMMILFKIPPQITIRVEIFEKIISIILILYK